MMRYALLVWMTVHQGGYTGYKWVDFGLRYDDFHSCQSAADTERASSPVIEDRGFCFPAPPAPAIDDGTSGGKDER